MRDELLVVAGRVSRDAEERGCDPASLAQMLVEAWRAEYPDAALAAGGARPAGPEISVDTDFVPDRASGVESLTFLVRNGTGPDAAGILLRFPSQFPDSFEPIATDERVASDHAELRARFFGRRDGR